MVITKQEIERLVAERGCGYFENKLCVGPIVMHGWYPHPTARYLPKPEDPDYDPIEAAKYSPEAILKHVESETLRITGVKADEHPPELLVKNEFGYPKLVERLAIDVHSSKTAEGEIKIRRRLSLEKIAATVGWSEYFVKERMSHIVLPGFLPFFSAWEGDVLRVFQEFEKKRKVEEAEKTAEAEARKRRRIERDKIADLKQKKVLEQLEKESKQKAMEDLMSKIDPEKLLNLAESL